MNWEIKHGSCLDVLKTLDSESVQCCVTSPPYWSLRDYGIPGQIGWEDTPDEFANKLADVFDEVRRVVFAKKEFRLKSRSASVMSDVWAFSQETQSNHPAPFPLELPKRILSTVAPSEKPILDPFLGSGTTRLAAHDAGFNFIGIELSKAYFNAQEERFARHVAQGNLLIPSEPIAEQGSLLG